MAKVEIQRLRGMSTAMLEAMGVPAAQAEIIADTVVYAHTHARATHGITRFPIYIRKIREGLMTADTQVATVCDLPALCVLDAGNGFGQIAVHEGMRRCIEKARQCGLGGAGIRNSNNFGVAAYFTEMAAREKMVGVLLGAAAPAIAPTGGRKPIFGTNPICVALPNREGKAPIILDMATSEAARGKIRLAAKNNEKIPFGWAIDAQGNPTDDPNAALEGTMLPIGGYKGYGIALMVDAIAGLLSGSAFAGDIKPLNEPHAFSRHGHALLAINIEALMPYEEYLQKIDTLIGHVRACGEAGKVLLPGEIEFSAAQQNRETVEINARQTAEFNALAESMGIGDAL